MKKSMKTSLFIISLGLLTCVAVFVWLGTRSDKPDYTVAERISDTAQGPSFEVRIAVPRLGRPFAGIVPDWVVRKFDLTPGELRFDHGSPGARIGSVGQDRVELLAEGWNFSIESDGEGRVTAGTRLVFPLGLGGRQVKLRCRPADQPIGYLRTTKRPSSEELEGRFIVEFANCENAESNKAIEWPPAPLTVRGSFVGPATRPSSDSREDRSKPSVKLP